MLGSRKFLIFAAVSALLLSLLVVCASAAVPEDLKAFGGGGVVKIAPADFQIPKPNLFRSTTYVGTKTGDDSSFGSGLISAYPESSPVYVTFISVQVQDEVGGWSRPSYTESFDSPVEVFFKDYNGWVLMSVDGEELDFGWRSVGRVRAAFQNSVDALSPVGNEMTIYTLSPSFDMGALLVSILGIGTQLISFVVARPIVLIPIVAMILVLSYGVIRRLIKGV